MSIRHLSKGTKVTRRSEMSVFFYSDTYKIYTGQAVKIGLLAMIEKKTSCYKQKEIIRMNEINSLEYTSWNYK